MTFTPQSVDFPSSNATVSVKIFNAFRDLDVISAVVLSPAPGSTSDESRRFKAPGKSFLVEHPDGRRVVFDLGIRKDVENIVQSYRDEMREGATVVDFGPDIAETLVGGGIPLDSINAVIWSHSHWDHIGNTELFPLTTALVVGPGTQAHVRPGRPLSLRSHPMESEFVGRKVVEIEFAESDPVLLGLKMHDFFGDGSFYLVEAPGHCPGHIIGLARTTPTTFILMGGDTCHHQAIIRPSLFLPLPSHLVDSLPEALKSCAHDAPFLNMPLLEHTIHHDHATAKATIQKLTVLDAHPNVFVVLSHDGAMDPVPGEEGGIEFFPHAANDWKAKGWKEEVHWRFLQNGNRANRWV